MSLRARAWLLGAALCLPSASSSAHELQTNTAQVSLRDGNIVIYADIDIVAWVSAIGGQREPLALSSVDPAQLARWTAEARRQLTHELRIEADGELLELVVREFPSDDAIARAAARELVAQQLDDHHHRERERVIVEILAPRVLASEIGVTMPESLGEVLVNFVQPQTRLAVDGTPSSFRVLRAADDLDFSEITTAGTEPSMSAASITPAALGGLLGAFAVGLLCGTVALRPRTRTR